MSLRCCLAGVPGAIVYKTHPLTYSIGKSVVKVDFLGIANILLNRGMWREFLQGQFKPKLVANYILQCMQSEQLRQSFGEAARELGDILAAKGDMSAARWLLSSME
jgi:lipid-A-disaccharide synthase